MYRLPKEVTAQEFITVIEAYELEARAAASLKIGKDVRWARLIYRLEGPYGSPYEASCRIGKNRGNAYFYSGGRYRD